MDAFFVTPIGQEGSPDRKRADALLIHVLQPVLSERFDIVRADHIDKPGNINHDIIQRLYSADLVIADLTGFNPNVMYEVGVRHSFNKPIVQLAQQGEKLPFDVATERTIFFDINDLDSIKKAEPRIRNAVDAAVNDQLAYRSPIHQVLNIIAVFDQGGDVAEAIEAISGKIEAISDKIDVLDFSNGLEFGDVIDEAVSTAISEASSQFNSDKIDRLYELFSSLRPYDVDQLIDKLRKL